MLDVELPPIKDQRDSFCARNENRIIISIDEFVDLEIEAILTPDGKWHEPESFELSDSEAWVTRARQLLEQNRQCLALKHVFHI